MIRIEKEISDKIFLADLKKEFLKTIISSINDFKKYSKTNDFNKIREIAHNIKGISGVFGFDYGSELAKKIQLSIDEKNHTEAESCLSELIEYYQNSVIPELKLEETTI